MQFDFLAILQVGAVAAIGWALYRNRNAKRATKAAHEFAWKKFRATSIENVDPRYSFNGAACRVLKVEETGLISDPTDKSYGNYALAIFAENDAHEVFHFRFSAGRSMVKHVAPNVVRAVLDTHAPTKQRDA